MKKLSPSLFNDLITTYLKPSQLYIENKILLSLDGTTQGDPLANPMYGVSVPSLIRLVTSNCLTHKWYADDGYLVGMFRHLQRLFSSLKKHGPNFGYERTKFHLVVKPGMREKAAFSFKENVVDFIDSHRVLESFIGKSDSHIFFSRIKRPKFNKEVSKAF